VIAKKVVHLSPDAHGTLNALRTLRVITHYEDRVADELVAAGLARRQGRELSITYSGLMDDVRLRADANPPRLSCGFRPRSSKAIARPRRDGGAGH
jgi:hypothetical protein